MTETLDRSRRYLRPVALNKRCDSCEHPAQYHAATGECWFSVTRGTPGRNIVCACSALLPTVEEADTEETP